MGNRERQKNRKTENVAKNGDIEIDRREREKDRERDRDRERQRDREGNIWFISINKIMFFLIYISRYKYNTNNQHINWG